jgi:hypothetical protein
MGRPGKREGVRKSGNVPPGLMWTWVRRRGKHRSFARKAREPRTQEWRGRRSALETVEKPAYERLLENGHMQGFRNPEEWRRTEKYAAVTRDEGNAADGRFPTASLVF